MIAEVNLAPGVPSGARLAVFSIATSDLQPATGKLLEVGVVALDRALPPTTTNSFHAIIQHDAEALLDTMDPKVATMHAENGLLDHLVGDVGTSLENVDAALAKWLDMIGACGEHRTPLIAQLATWTETWLAAYLPRTLARLGRDQIEVGALLRCYDVPRKRGNGRALDEAMLTAVQFGSLFPGVSRVEEMRKWVRAQ